MSEHHPTPESPDDATEKLMSIWRKEGLYIGIFGENDEPDSQESPHAHGAARIHVVEGSATVLLEQEDGTMKSIDCKPGDTVQISEGQRHAVTIGPSGWRYMFGCDEAEAKSQGIIKDLMPPIKPS